MIIFKTMKFSLRDTREENDRNYLMPVKRGIPVKIGGQVPVIYFLNKKMFKTEMEGIVHHLLIFFRGDSPVQGRKIPSSQVSECTGT